MKPQTGRAVKKSAPDRAPDPASPSASAPTGSLAGQVALVTGAAIRLGRAIALALAREGCHVAVHYHRSVAAARATVRELRALGVEAQALRADVSEPADARRLVRETLRHFGRVDLLVNNAGVFFRTPLPRTTPAQWDRLLAVNLRAPFLVSQSAASAMLRAGAGRIVNIADVAGLRAWPSYIPYCVSKAGLLMLTRGLALALAPRVQVNCVAPGTVLLPGAAHPALRRQLRREVPMGREGDPRDVAAAVIFFATCPPYITGQVLFVDGGLTAR